MTNQFNYIISDENRINFYPKSGKINISIFALKGFELVQMCFLFFICLLTSFYFPNFPGIHPLDGTLRAHTQKISNFQTFKNSMVSTLSALYIASMRGFLNANFCQFYANSLPSFCYPIANLCEIQSSTSSELLNKRTENDNKGKINSRTDLWFILSFPNLPIFLLDLFSAKKSVISTYSTFHAEII